MQAVSAARVVEFSPRLPVWARPALIYGTDGLNVRRSRGAAFAHRSESRAPPPNTRVTFQPALDRSLAPALLWKSPRIEGATHGSARFMTNQAFVRAIPGCDRSLVLPPLPVPRISPPSISEFYRAYVLDSHPVAITGLVADWPALERWNLKYFDENFGDVRAGAYPLKAGECDVNANRGSSIENIPVRDTLASIAQGRTDGGLALASLVDRFPASLKMDYRVPIYCRSGNLLTSRIFLGPEGTLSPLHQDLPENLYVMVKGKKRVTLFSPQSPVYPSRFSKLPNHARVDPEKPDYERFPSFRNAQSYSIDLGAGETLFIPSLWWHHLHNLEPSMAVNFWWPTGWKSLIVGAIAAYRNMYRKWMRI